MFSWNIIWLQLFSNKYNDQDLLMDKDNGNINHNYNDEDMQYSTEGVQNTKSEDNSTYNTKYNNKQH